MSSFSTPDRAAIIGTGFIGAVHLDALRRLGVTVRGVLGSSPERSRDFADRWNLSIAYSSVEQLVEDAEISTVHVTSPNALHFRQVLTVLDAGKNVVCEKPRATSSEDARLLVKRAERAGVVNALNYNMRFYPLVREMHERIRRGDAGAIHLVSGAYFQDWLSTPDDWNWRIDADRGGPLRSVADIGTHWFDLTSYLIGEPIVELSARLVTTIPTRRRPAQNSNAFSTVKGPRQPVSVLTDDAALISLRYANGAYGNVVVSQVSPGRKNALSVELAGEVASYRWNGEAPDGLWIGHRATPNEVLLKDPTLLSEGAAAVARVPGGHSEGFENTFVALYDAVYRHIKEGGPRHRQADYPTFRDGLYEAELLDAVRKSAASGHWVNVQKG